MDSIHKFQDLLKRLFQFDTSDLDFGIYRILNHKRELIRKFIQDDLVNKLESAFARYKDERLININERFEEARKKVVEELNPDVFTPTGNLKEEFKNTGVGRKYLSIKEQKDEAQTIDEMKIQVFNDLYSFFSRFYEEGDFVPQYRYSIKGHKYAIPYNGDEVKLYWANNEQYYTKTGLLFRDYTFKANHYKIIFRIVSAREELGSTKATRARFFVLDDGNPVELNEKALIIRFQYRELTEEEVISYEVGGGSNISKQAKINHRSYKEVLKEIKDIELEAGLGKDYKNEKPLLLYQISRFAAKNTKDYFIHKNLKKFLSEQLDFFIKAEVLSIETLEKEKFLDKHIARAKVVREIGEDIIDFLSQIEDFQKKLWEKKKFVLKTEYVITTDRVPEEFYNEIWNNKEQKKEWKELGFDLPKTKGELKKTKLPTDTKYFSQEFKERLLERLTKKADLDSVLDGLLIKSENWQALNLLLGKYKEKVQTIYIDPPFNKEQNADYLYNVKYKDTTWVAFLENRLLLGKEILKDKGNIFVRCDYNGNMLVRLLMNEIFHKDNFRNEIVINRTLGKKKIGESLPVDKDSIFLFSRNLGAVLNEIEKPLEKAELINYIIQYLTKKELLNNNLKDELLNILWVPLDHRPGERQTSKERMAFGKIFYPPKGRHWIKSQEKLDKLKEEDKLRLKCTNCNCIHHTEEWEKCHKCKQDTPIIEVFLDTGPISESWLDIGGYSQTWKFQTENSEQLLRRVVESSSSKSDTIMDFFLGVGTTVAVAHKLNRRWVGVEMGEHFYSFQPEFGALSGVMVRMKEVLARKGNHEPCGLSREINWQGGGFFKYQTLEQYEDTLDNIELRENKQAQLKFGDDYLLKYFLDYETRENSHLLNIEHLKNPFSYKLRINPEEVGEPQEMAVDIPETFNYLLGLEVKKIKVRNNGRKYLFICGEKEGKDIAIIWREYDDKWNENDLKKDKEFIIKELAPWTPHIVYVNGQSVLTPKLGERPVEIRCIEPEFKRLMEE